MIDVEEIYHGGTLTKTGPGTLGIGLRGNSDPWYVPQLPTGGDPGSSGANYDLCNYSSIPPSDYLSTDIQQGGVVIGANSVVPTMPFTIREGAWLSLNGAAVTLGSVEGNGTVADGTLDSTYLFDRTVGLLNFQNVATPPGFTVKFDREKNGSLPARAFPVATFTGAAPDVATWQSDKISATFSIDGDTIYAKAQMSTLILVM